MPINSSPDGSGGKGIYLERKNDKLDETSEESGWRMHENSLYSFCNLSALLKLIQNKREGWLSVIGNSVFTLAPFLPTIRVLCWRWSSQLVARDEGRKPRMASRGFQLDPSWHLRASAYLIHSRHSGFLLPGMVVTVDIATLSNVPSTTQSASGRTGMEAQVCRGLQTKHAFVFHTMLKPKLLSLWNGNKNS